MWARGDWGTLIPVIHAGVASAGSSGSPLALERVGCQQRLLYSFLPHSWLCWTLHTTPGGSKGCVFCLARWTCQHGPRGGAWFEFVFSLLVILMKPLVFPSLKFQKYFNIFGLNWLRKISWILRMMKWSPGHTEIVKTFCHWISMKQGFCWQLL